MSKFASLGDGTYKRRRNVEVGVFIDGVNLDRATKRLHRRVDLSALVRGVSGGKRPIVARYYTLIPHEDDARQHSFLDAVARAGLRVVVKRLPPKGVTRQASFAAEMASDMVAFALGHSSFSTLSEYTAGADSKDSSPRSRLPKMNSSKGPRTKTDQNSSPDSDRNVESEEAPPSRSLILVCPSPELIHPISLANEFGAETVSADFGKFKHGDMIKSAQKWIDLSDSETIWLEDKRA